MAYIKTVWKTGDIVTSTGLNNMENELEYLDSKGAIYFAIYGSTKYTDVINALNKGEQVLCEKSNKIFTISSKDSSIIKFSCIQDSVMYFLTLNSSNTWSEGSSELMIKPTGIANGQTVTYNSSTGSFVATDFSTDTFYAGVSAPTNKKILWIDTNAGGLKYYNGSAWVAVPTFWV